MAQTGEHWPGLPGTGEPQAPERRALRPVWQRYLIAVLLVAAATGARAGLLSLLGMGSPFVTFYPAVVLAALFGGLGPGVLATLLSVFAASFWMEPFGVPLIHNPADWLLVTTFLVNIMIISAICEALRRARARAVGAEARGLVAEALRESEETFRSLFDQAAVPTAVQGPDGTIRRANPAYCHFLGYTEKELQTLTVWDITCPDDREQVTPLMHRLLTGELSLYRSEKRYRHKTGTVLWGDLNLSLLRDKKGRPLYFIVQVQDITERKQAEAALRESEERFRAAFEYGAIPMALTALDYRLLKVNPAFCSVMGYAETELVGHNFCEITHPDDVAENLAGLQRLVSGEISSFCMEKRYLRKDGRIIWGDMCTAFVRDLEGKPLYFVTHVQDITERKRTEEALGQNRELLRAVIEGTSDAVFVKDPDGRYLLFNPAAARYTGKRVEDVISQDDTFLFAPDEARVVMAGDRAVMAAGKTVTYEEHITDATGKRLIFHATKGPLLDAQGKLIGLFGISRDITDLKQAEEVISVREEALRQAVRVSDLGIFDHDQRADTIQWSPRMREICGWSGEEPVGLPEFLGQVHPADRDAIVAAIGRAHDPAGDGRYSVEHRLVRPDGGLRWLSIRSQTFFETEGERRRPVRTIGVALDITERKRTEEAMRVSEERLRRAQEISHLGSWELDLRHNRLIWSDEVYRIFGLPPREFEATYEAFLERIHPDDRAAVDAAYSCSLREGRDSYEIEHRIVRKSTGEIRFVHEKCEHFRDAAGHIIRSVGMVHDITERKQTEEALRESEANLRAAQRIARIGSWQWDIVDNSASWSEETYCIFGLAPGQLTQHRQNFLEMVHPGDRARVGQALQDALAGVNEYDLEYRILWPDKTEKMIQSRAEVIRAADGRPLMMRGTVHDITERKRAEAELREANARLTEADRRKDEFLAMLAHELRNPLAPVRNAVEILRMAGPQESILMRQRDIIDRQVAHMARLVDDLLDVSRITRGRIELKKRTLRLANALDHAMELVTPHIETRRQKLSYMPPPDDLCITADPDRLAQAVGNLLANAAKYTEEGGQLWLAAEREGEEAVIRVRDTGMGIAPEMLPRVFELFAQADQGLARSQGGLGIGLTMVKRLVELHGGSVEARSAGLGRGSEFIVRLPVFERRPAPSSEVQVPGGTEGRAGRAPEAQPVRILVVDDVVDSAESLAEMLRLFGHEARTAYDGPAALKMFCDFMPDMVLLDIGMPGMDGYEVARRLRQQECGRNALLVALTGYAQDSDREAARAAGFDHHLAKPVELEALRELLAQRAAPRP